MLDPAIAGPVLDDIQEDTGLSRYDIMNALHDWDAIPGCIDGVQVAAIIKKGTEVHFAIEKAYRKKTICRHRAREFLAPLMEEYGYITTKLLHKYKGQQRFIERIGFKKTWSDDRFNYFMLSELPFERKSK